MCSGAMSIEQQFVLLLEDRPLFKAVHVLLGQARSVPFILIIAFSVKSNLFNGL